jgi:hypothetical protein
MDEPAEEPPAAPAADQHVSLKDAQAATVPLLPLLDARPL